jgi:hypothetical protein
MGYEIFPTQKPRRYIAAFAVVSGLMPGGTVLTSTGAGTGSRRHNAVAGAGLATQLANFGESKNEREKKELIAKTKDEIENL